MNFFDALPFNLEEADEFYRLARLRQLLRQPKQQRALWDFLQHAVFLSK